MRIRIDESLIAVLYIQNIKVSKKYVVGLQCKTSYVQRSVNWRQLSGSKEDASGRKERCQNSNIHLVPSECTKNIEVRDGGVRKAAFRRNQSSPSLYVCYVIALLAPWIKYSTSLRNVLLGSHSGLGTFLQLCRVYMFWLNVVVGLNFLFSSFKLPYPQNKGK